jgi:hypothetical protein
MAYIEISVPAPAANVSKINVVYRRNVAGEFMVAHQLRNDGVWPKTARIDDLECAVVYQIGTQAFAASKGSAVTAATSSPFTAPSPPAPAAPTGLSLSVAAADLYRIPPAYPGAGGAKYAAAMLKFTAPADKGIAYFEARLITTGVPGRVIARTHATETEIPLYAGLQVNPFTDEIQVRAVNTAGTAGTWSANLSAFAAFSFNYGTQDMAEQAKNNVNVTGGKAIMGGFEANQTTAVDVKAVNLRVFDSGGTQRARFDNTTGNLWNNGVQVVGGRKTGWSAPTGAVSRGTFDPSTVTTEELAKRVSALIQDAGTTSGHGLIDA